MMRLLSLGLMLAFFGTQSFGQLVVQDKPNLPVNPPLPRQYSLNPRPATGGALPGLATALPFRTWQDVLKQDSTPATVKLTPSGARTLASEGHCSIPLLSVPLPEHYDDKFVQKVSGHMDDKIAIEPPPDCPLRAAQANEPKHK